MDMKPNNLRILIEAALLDIFKDEPKVNDVKVGDVWYSPNALTFKIRISTSHIQEPTRKVLILVLNEKLKLYSTIDLNL